MKWTKEEEEYLKENCHKKSKEELCEYFKRSWSNIIVHARKIGIYKYKDKYDIIKLCNDAKKYSLEELTILYNVSKKQMRYILLKYNIKCKRHRWFLKDKKFKEEFTIDYATLTWGDLSDKYNQKKETLQAWAKRFKIKKKPIALSKQQLQADIDNYMTLKDMSEKYDIDCSEVQRHINIYNLKYDPNIRYYQLKGKKYGLLTFTGNIQKKPMYKTKQVYTIGEFRCECGNVIWRVFGAVTRGDIKSCGCLKTKQQSIGEVLVEEILKSHNIKYKKEQDFEGCRNKQPLYYDFYLPDHNLLIEFNGRQHYTRQINGIFENTADFDQRKLHDKIKKEYALQNKIELLVISYKNLYKMEEIICKKLNLAPNQEAYNTKLTDCLLEQISYKLSIKTLEKELKTKSPVQIARKYKINLCSLYLYIKNNNIQYELPHLQNIDVQQYIGKKYGKLTIQNIERYGTGYRATCKCDCGNECQYALTEIVRKRKKKCCHVCKPNHSKLSSMLTIVELTEKIKTQSVIQVAKEYKVAPKTVTTYLKQNNIKYKSR